MLVNNKQLIETLFVPCAKNKIRKAKRLTFSKVSFMFTIES